jgi:hypothetical protein
MEAISPSLFILTHWDFGVCQACHQQGLSLTISLDQQIPYHASNNSSMWLENT